MKLLQLRASDSTNGSSPKSVFVSEDAIGHIDVYHYSSVYWGAVYVGVNLVGFLPGEWGSVADCISGIKSYFGTDSIID